MIDLLAAAQARDDLVFLRLTVGWNDPADGLADHLRGGVAEDALSRSIPGLNDAVQILADDRIVARLDDRREAPGLQSEVFLGRRIHARNSSSLSKAELRASRSGEP